MQEELNNGQDRYTFAMEDTNKFKMLFNQAESDFFALKKVDSRFYINMVRNTI